MNKTIFKQAILAATLSSSSLLVQAGSDDWLCDLTINNNPPTGCSRWGIQQQGGLCTSYQLTGVWHCLTGWDPGTRPGEYGDQEMAIKSLLPNKLVRSEYALSESAPEVREARLQVRSARILASAPLLILLPDEQSKPSVRVSAVRGQDGQVELQIHSIERNAAGSEQLIGRLPIRQDQATVLTKWRIDPVDGPRLTLASGISAVDVSLPALNAYTRIDIYGGSASTLHFDVGNPVQMRRDVDHSRR